MRDLATEEQSAFLDAPPHTEITTWPLNSTMTHLPDDDEPVCITHARWFIAPSCLSDRHDKEGEPCVVAQDETCAAIVRDLHSAKITHPEAVWLLAEAITHGSKTEDIA